MKMRFRHTACHGRPGRAPSLTPAATSTWACLPEPHHVPQPTPHKGETCWPDPRKMGRSDSTRKMNSRMSDSNVWGLNPQHGFWYVPVQPKRPFIIPIPKLSKRILNEPMNTTVVINKIKFSLMIFCKSGDF